MLGTRKMRWGGATTVVALIAGMLVFGGLLQPTASASAAPGGGSFMPLVAGQPGVPSDPGVLYEENFENNVAGTPVLLTNYVGASGMTYSANQAWLQNCNGAVLRYTSPNSDQFGPAINNCEPTNFVDADQFSRDIAYLRLRELSWALGSLNGAANPALNHSVAAYTHGANPGANLVQFRTNSSLSLPSANGRYVTFSVDSAAVNCFASAPQHQFSLIRSDGSELPVGGTINACQDGTVINVPAAGGGTGTIPAVAKTSSSNGSILFSGSTLGVSLRNANGSGAGNDAAFDNIRILDGTPQLDKSFSPTSVPVGGVSTLTFTVTNTSELAAKAGWSFTDSLPSGLVVANTPNVGGNCAATTTAAAGATSISIANGTLTAGQVSCTVTVDVTSSTPLPDEPSPKTYTNCAANITAVVGLDLPNCASVEFYSQPDLEIAKRSTGTADSRPGDVIEYTVDVTNTGTQDYTDVFPAVLTDDLSDVLDDATYNDDATVVFSNGTTGAAPVLSGTQLTWSGALKAGETATFTYSVTLVSGGNGHVENVACLDQGTSAGGGGGGGVFAVGDCASTVTDLPRLSIDKSADRTELPAVGDQVTYTVVVTNEGPGDYSVTAPATVTDDLSEVLDDATFDDASLASDVGTVTRAGDTLSWTGPLAAGASATITYTVTYTGDGDNVLRNRACVPESDVAPGFLPCDVVRIPGAALQQWKTAAPSSNPVVAGSTITYTLFFDNDGEAGATVDAVDDLTHVLDDAEVTTEPTSADGLTVVRNGAEISITGTVPAGERYTVTYTVTVLPDDERGDSIASNFLLAPGEEPPTDPECVPTDADFPNCTTTPITGVAYTKAVAASETPVVEGTELTYTITVRNTGAAVVDVVRDDDLTDVLDDADLTTAPASDTSSVTLDGPTDGILAIRGDLAVGATATITYTVTVKAQSERGDSTANNFLVPPGTTPPAECDPADGQCTSTPIQGYTVSKTADTAVANPGSVVTYTVTVANTGTVDFTDADPVAFTDDLTEVLDDAVYNGDVTAGGSVTGNTLTWAGPLAVGATVTITYSVTVNDPVTGDQVLTNTVVPTVPGGECDPEAECIVETPIASFTVAKAADVATALPGDVVTYTVTVTNTGTADYTADAPASFTDDLTAVLDDATYNGDVSTGGAVTGNTLTWSGALAVDQTVEVTYSVTVNDPITGDKDLLNTVIPTAPGGTCTADGECATSTPVGSYTVAKEASAESVLPGGTITYTVTVTNTSEVDYTDARPATFTDDLSGVLDDAVYNDDVSAGGSVTGPTLTWSGALPAGESVTVTYSVTVDSPVTGDFVLRNAVTPTGPGGSCAEVCETETPISALRVVKSTESTEVLPGGVVEYTIAITNTGQVDYTDAAPASFTDDLSGVLDDAAYNGDATSSTGAGAAYAAPVLSWSGPLAIGDTVTVTYSVTVNDPATGDDRLENTVVTPPGVGGNCEPGSTDPACVANVPSGSYTVEKTADPTTALPGDVVTYTVTVTNTGEVAYTDEDPASFSDDLSRVLDDAAYNGDVSPGGAVSGTTLTWSGALAVGESLQVTYSVTVDDPVEGDFTLRNVVAPTSPGGECVEGACIIDTPIAAYTVNKTSDAADTVLGGVVTYSVTVTNIGQVDYTDAVPATFTDDLSGVLDDATYNGDASNGATVTGNTLDWSGAVPIGETVTVTYSVTVNQPGTGDRRLVNTVLPTGPGGSCTEAGDCETDTPIASYRVIKTVSTEQATIGDRVTFTITVSNTGQVPYTAERPASFTDDLTSALQVATYNGDATGGAVYSEPVLSWAGDLDVGDVRAITYSVTVTKVGEIRNVVVTPDGSGANCSVGSEDPDCVTLTRIVPPLAITGGEMWWAGGIAGATFLALGLWLTVRRRRDTVGTTADI
ncbi:LPXTG cell wall anchor domain-containing protein [Microbacterium sp. 22179]|uniref:DUF7927 domain-containing protein n=1 Tax=Microbacterium sp. 22179 TaxID=3453886 RepID=UPI003F85B1E6